MKGFAIYTCEFGIIRIDYEDEKVIALKKIDTSLILPDAKTSFTNNVFLELSEYFMGKRKQFTFAYELNGTQFQKRVWTALCSIQYGETCSYRDIANAIGNPNACRAVGMANNKNPIIIVVPCHRVIGSNKGTSKNFSFLRCTLDL